MEQSILIHFSLIIAWIRGWFVVVMYRKNAQLHRWSFDDIATVFRPRIEYRLSQSKVALFYPCVIITGKDFSLVLLLSGSLAKCLSICFSAVNTLCFSVLNTLCSSVVKNAGTFANIDKAIYVNLSQIIFRYCGQHRRSGNDLKFNSSLNRMIKDSWEFRQNVICVSRIYSSSNTNFCSPMTGHKCLMFGDHSSITHRNVARAEDSGAILYIFVFDTFVLYFFIYFSYYSSRIHLIHKTHFARLWNLFCCLKILFCSYESTQAIQKSLSRDVVNFRCPRDKTYENV